MCMCDLHMARWGTLKPAISFWSLQLGRSVCESLSHVWLFSTPWDVAHQAPLSMNFPGKNTGAGCHFLLQGIFLTQGMNPGLLHCRQTLPWVTSNGERESNKAQGGDETRCLSGTKMKVQHSHCPKSSLISSPLPFCSVLPKVQISLDIWDQSKNSRLREKSHKHADGSYYKLTVSNLNLAWS